MEEEVAMIGPNAQSLNPDFFPLIQGESTANASKGVPGKKSAATDPTVQSIAAALGASALTIQILGSGPTSATSATNAATPTPTVSAIPSNDTQAANPVATIDLTPTVGSAVVDPTTIGTAKSDTPTATFLPPDPGVSPTASGNSAGKVSPTASGLHRSGPKSDPVGPTTDKPGGTPVSDDPKIVDPTVHDLPPSATATVTVSPTALGQSGPSEEAEVSPTAKGDTPPPTVGVRTAKKGDDKSSADPTVHVTEETSDGAKVVKVTGKNAKTDSDAEGSATGAQQKAHLNVVNQNAGAASAEVTNEKPPLKASDLNLVVKQIADKMELLAATRPKDGITIQLQPDRLGSITMTIKSDSGGVQAHISASDDNVRTALEQNRAMLGQALADRGLKLDAVSIAAQTRDSTMAQQQASYQQQQQQQGMARQAQSQAMPHLGSGHELMTVQQVRQTVRSFDGVDLWI
ncbi:MAG TPA: flagellar hook-length control protein FliK [Fimbriimonadaceae bacterium]|nr:flagellar hook-length control protein FliK [Fimbriimonadaceae bacterium]